MNKLPKCVQHNSQVSLCGQECVTQQVSDNSNSHGWEVSVTVKSTVSRQNRGCRLHGLTYCEFHITDISGFIYSFNPRTGIKVSSNCPSFHQDDKCTYCNTRGYKSRFVLGTRWVLKKNNGMIVLFQKSISVQPWIINSLVQHTLI